MALIGRKLPDLLTRWGSESQDDDTGCDDLWQRALSVCQGIVDVGFSLKTLQNPKVRFRLNISVFCSSYPAVPVKVAQVQSVSFEKIFQWYNF